MYNYSRQNCICESESTHPLNALHTYSHIPFVDSIKVMLHGTTCNDDFLRNTSSTFRAMLQESTFHATSYKMNLATCMLHETIFQETRLETFCVDCDEEERKVKRERELLLQLAPSTQRRLISHYSRGLLKSASLRCHNQQQTPFCLFTSQVPWDFRGLVKFHARSEVARILGRCCAKNRWRTCYTG